MSKGNKFRDVQLLDTLPRFAEFKIPLKFPMSASSAQYFPEMQRISLPYQVRPDGKILCAQLLRAELHYSPFVHSQGVSSDGLNNFGLYWVTQRVVFDAGQKIDTNKPWASVNTDPLRNPYSVPSIVGFDERQFARQFIASTTIQPPVEHGALYPVEPMRTISFGCGEAKPVIPSGAINIWGFMTMTWDDNGAAITAPLARANGSSGISTTQQNTTAYDGIGYGYSQWLEQQLPDPDGGTETAGPARYAFCQGRLWYQLVLLTPYQHLALADKYREKNFEHDVQFYDTSTINPATGLPYNTINMFSNTTNPGRWDPL